MVMDVHTSQGDQILLTLLIATVIIIIIIDLFNVGCYL